MRNYVILLIPNKETIEKVEKIRKEKTGAKLVDDLLPHITFKGLFSLKYDHDMKEVINIMDGFDISEMKIEMSGVKRFSDAVALTIDDDYLFSKHKELAALLSESVESKYLAFEGDNFNPHMTLFRSSDSREFELKDFNIFDAIICEMSLFEIGENFAKEIFSKKL